MKDRIVVAITGASGSMLGIMLLEILKEQDNIETHLVMSSVSKKIIKHETGHDSRYVENLSDFVYDEKDFFSPIASGSFDAKGMVIVPCSMKTLSALSIGYGSNLVTRAADVMLKERRKLVIVPREAPLNLIHIKNMETLSLAGAIIFPPVLTLYSRPKTINDLMNHLTGKILDLLGIKNDIYIRWGEK